MATRERLVETGRAFRERLAFLETVPLERRLELLRGILMKDGLEHPPAANDPASGHSKAVRQEPQLPTYEEAVDAGSRLTPDSRSRRSRSLTFPSKFSIDRSLVGQIEG